MKRQKNWEVIPTNRKKQLVQAMCLVLPMTAQAAVFEVTVSNDDGTGLTQNTLSWSILQANQQAGDDAIILRTDVAITGVMKRLIDSNVSMQSDQIRRTISGQNQYRPLFIKSGIVTIANMNITEGEAKGGNPGGAGLGGALFMYDGNLTLSDVTISNSVAEGSSNSSGSGGGMFGNSPSTYDSGGGGLFASAVGSTGGYGGYGNYRDKDPYFGAGGDLYMDGGFGGGGGGADGYANGGHAGFGGSGGSTYDGRGGDGGFGGSAGDSYKALIHGEPGFGANRIFGAGMGGAVFVRSGVVSFNNVRFTGNQAAGGFNQFSSAQGLGGALFILHTLSNSNGNNRGMPSTLPYVDACGLQFFTNSATSDSGTANNNDDVFDLANIIISSTGGAITDPCPVTDLIFVNGFD